MKICVIGTGYVGLATAAVFAELGNDVVAADMDKGKIDNLNKGIMPIFEPGLKEIVERNAKHNRLHFTHDNKAAIKHGDVIFICVGTPPKDNWETELLYVENVAKEIASVIDSYKVIVHKSTVPVETGDKIRSVIKQHLKHEIEFDVVSNPEFLREGTAIKDTLEPDRIVIGSESDRASEVMKKLYSHIKAPIIITDIRSAELIKHASNSFLATKISFINALGQICERTGADVEKVAEGMGLDKRIGRAFLNAGIGYGGSCFPKDIQAFINISKNLGYDFSILKATHDINESQSKQYIDKVKKYLGDVHGKTIGVLGLSFKPNTDDMRFAPSIPIIEALQREGAIIRAYDPEAMGKAGQLLKIQFCKSPYDAAADADALLTLTEWNEFKRLDLRKIKSLLKNPLIIDGRNIYSLEEMKKHGFHYISIGRKEITP